MSELLRAIIPQVIIPWAELFQEELLYGNVLYESHTFLAMTSVWLGTVEMEVQREEAYFRAGAQRRRTLIVLFGSASN